MFTRFFSWLLSMAFAFTLGAGMAGTDRTSDSELQQKVQEHVDVIVDESAAIVDDVIDEARKNENVQKAEEFVNDVQEITANTVDDIHAHFDETEEMSEAAGLSETEEETVPETETP